MTQSTDPARTESVIAAVGPQRYRELIGSFAQQLETLAARLQSPAAAADTIRREAHRLRGAAATLGQAAVSETLAQLEREAEGGHPTADWGYRLSAVAQGLLDLRHAQPIGTNR